MELDKFLERLDNCDDIGYKHLIDEVIDNYPNNNLLAKIKFCLNLTKLTRKINNSHDVLKRLFDVSIEDMKNLSHLRERNHILVEITKTLVDLSEDKFDKSYFIEEVIKMINQIAKEKDPDLDWIVKDIREVLIKSTDYKDFVIKIQVLF